MTDFRLVSHDDDEVARGLRSLYAAPSGDAYWNELESRIMARVADVELGWWTELDRWIRPAVAAAAVLLLAAGVAMFRARQIGGRHRGRQHVVVAIRTCIDGHPAGVGQRPRRADPLPLWLFFPGARMQRSKQTALMFLLGATLVGGALGFSADRYLSHEKVVSQFAPRPKFYDDLGLSQQQRATLDSLMFQQDCLMRAAMTPTRPKLDTDSHELPCAARAGPHERSIDDA